MERDGERQTAFYETEVLYSGHLGSGRSVDCASAASPSMRLKKQLVLLG